ncbi:methyltransferase [Erythrobacter sp. KY5]|uniref:class I SAM-dependent methyltransferase n=1 Tax=Erythrobacter sp. KY5 TaxID=2011159 RepID=UPI000DBF0ECA|nr:class I SAM-dependent methyltransferase [Erythrobacter sp. KY5]AWW73611.1 methyltransferase [Erythrobacter sp. KY5]
MMTSTKGAVRHWTIAAASVLALAACAPGEQAPSDDEPAANVIDDEVLAEVLAHERRADDAKRDEFRNPGETLAFFGLAPDQTVIEYAPGGGWYTRILAPYLAEEGQYIAVGFAPEGIDSLGADFQARVREGGENFSAEQSEALGIEAEKLPFHFGDSIPDELDGTVDTVLIIRMMHNLLRWGIAESEIAALRDTLKPGGVIGVVQHRAKPDAADEFADGNAGYLKEADLVDFFSENGFELVDSSEINANPADTADHEAGVWTLPPTYALGDQDRDKYTAIGESDRMTLLFRKAE